MAQFMSQQALLDVSRMSGGLLAASLLSSVQQLSQMQSWAIGGSSNIQIFWVVDPHVRLFLQALLFEHFSKQAMSAWWPWTMHPS